MLLPGAARAEHQEDLTRGEVHVDARQGRSIGAGETEAVAGEVDRGRGQVGLSGSAPDRRTARSMVIAAKGRMIPPEMTMATPRASSASGA